MNGRRRLITLGVSLVMHMLLVVCIGFSLNKPQRIIQHIEVDLATTGAAVNPEQPVPAAQPSPAPTPEPSKPKPEPAPEPAPQPVVQPPQKKPNPRKAIKQPDAVKFEEVQADSQEAISTVADSAQKEPAKTGSIQTPAADNAQSGGKTADASKLQAWLAAIRARIAKAKRYPMMAERRRIQGAVVVSFRLSFDGSLAGEPHVTKSSGSSLLDSASVRAVKRAAPFPRFPGPPEAMPAEPLTVELDFVIR